MNKQAQMILGAMAVTEQFKIKYDSLLPKELGNIRLSDFVAFSADGTFWTENGDMNVEEVLSIQARPIESLTDEERNDWLMMNYWVGDDEVEFYVETPESERYLFSIGVVSEDVKAILTESGINIEWVKK